MRRRGRPDLHPPNYDEGPYKGDVPSFPLWRVGDPTGSRKRLPAVTVLVPTLGRDTLTRALRSLLAQTFVDWECVIILDGCALPGPAAEIACGDERFAVIALAARVGRRNHAGHVRNAALPRARAPWGAFLDDDDVLEPNYLGDLATAAEEAGEVDVWVFNMEHQDCILPNTPLDADDKGVNAGLLVVDNVGMSFAIRRPLLCGLGGFNPGQREDWDLLTRAHGAGARVARRPILAYRTRPV